MEKVILKMSLTQDGVMQAPARADEDRRGDFNYGDWGAPYFIIPKEVYYLNDLLRHDRKAMA